MPKLVSRYNEYKRLRKSLWKQVKAGIISWDAYHKRRAQLDKKFPDVVDDGQV